MTTEKTKKANEKQEKLKVKIDSFLANVQPKLSDADYKELSSLLKGYTDSQQLVTRQDGKLKDNREKIKKAEEAKEKAEGDARAALEAKEKAEGDARAALEAKEKAEGDARAALEAKEKAEGDARAALKAKEKAEGDARAALEAKEKAEGDARAALEAKEKAEGDARAALEAKEKAEGDARAALEAKEKAEGDARAALEAKEKVEGDARAALEAKEKAEGDARAALEAKEKAEAERDETNDNCDPITVDCEDAGGACLDDWKANFKAHGTTWVNDNPLLDICGRTYVKCFLKAHVDTGEVTNGLAGSASLVDAGE